MSNCNRVGIVKLHVWKGILVGNILVYLIKNIVILSTF